MHRLSMKSKSGMFMGWCNAVMCLAPSRMRVSVQRPMQMEGVRGELPEAASAVPQLIRRQSRGSQALQLARSLGSAGARFPAVAWLWARPPKRGLVADDSFLPSKARCHDGTVH